MPYVKFLVSYSSYITNGVLYPAGTVIDLPGRMTWALLGEGEVIERLNEAPSGPVAIYTPPAPIAPVVVAPLEPTTAADPQPAAVVDVPAEPVKPAAKKSARKSTRKSVRKKAANDGL